MLTTDMVRPLKWVFINERSFFCDAQLFLSCVSKNILFAVSSSQF